MNWEIPKKDLEKMKRKQKQKQEEKENNLFDRIEMSKKMTNKLEGDNER